MGCWLRWNYWFAQRLSRHKGWQLMISGVQKALISGRYPWYPAVVFGRNMAVFSYFSSFLLSDHCPLIPGLYLGTSSRYFPIFCWNLFIFNWNLVNFPLIPVHYTPDIRVISLISWYPVNRSPARCYPLGGHSNNALMRDFRRWVIFLHRVDLLSRNGWKGCIVSKEQLFFSPSRMAATQNIVSSGS